MGYSSALAARIAPQYLGQPQFPYSNTNDIFRLSYWLGACECFCSSSLGAESAESQDVMINGAQGPSIHTAIKATSEFLEIGRSLGTSIQDCK